MKKARFYLFYVLYLVATVGICSEILCRAKHWGPALDKKEAHYVEDAAIPYKLTPYYQSRSGSVLHFANSVGMRDSEHALTKPPGVFRIVGIGDSFTYGVGVNYEDAYLTVLEKSLNEHFRRLPPVEVIKAGIGGYGARAERLMLEHYGLKYNPDLIVVGFVPNDIIDAYYPTPHVRQNFLVTEEAKHFSDLTFWLFKNSQVARLLLSTYSNFKGRTYFKPSITWSEVYKANGVHEPEWLEIEKEYERMIDISKQNHADILFVHIPFNPEVPKKGAWEKEAQYPAERVRQFVTSRGAYFADALPLLRKAWGEGKELYIEDGHCNEVGYHLIGESVSRSILDLQFIPKTGTFSAWSTHTPMLKH